MKLRMTVEMMRQNVDILQKQSLDFKEDDGAVPLSTVFALGATVWEATAEICERLDLLIELGKVIGWESSIKK